MDDTPYESLPVTMLEHDLPGGHSPAYFAIVNNPPPFRKLYWGNDPAAFAGVPEYFLAHEIAHQWWGQAVGWKNYHEQWISEGFAQTSPRSTHSARTATRRSTRCFASSGAGASRIQIRDPSISATAWV
jgi:hypothetical protein